MGIACTFSKLGRELIVEVNFTIISQLYSYETKKTLIGPKCRARETALFILFALIPIPHSRT